MLFDSLIRRGVMSCCPPPRSGELDGLSAFAVTRWTNICFPVRRGGGIRGDWFGGGALAPLFGPGIREIAVSGNQPERLAPPGSRTPATSSIRGGATTMVTWRITSGKYLLWRIIRVSTCR